MRKVSLVRLEAACEEYAKQNKPLPPDMAYLAGLQRIDYVFVYPETGDLVIAGPAEGFAPDSAGRVIGLTTGRPPIRLDDLLVALRTTERDTVIGCSIDPVESRLADLQRYLRRNSSPTSTAIAAARYRQMAKILGMQDVKVFGVPAESHFAQALVEADWRMKLVSMGLEKVQVRGFRTHLSMLRPQGNTMQRWWFTPLYENCYATEDGLGYQLGGQRAQLLAQEEIAAASGQRSDAGSTRLTTQAYAQHFTEKFPELAEEVPAFAELQSLMDLAIVAALLRKERLPQKVGWSMSLFLDEDRAAVETGPVPRQIPSSTNYRMAGSRMVIGLIGGGIQINPLQTVRTIEFQQDDATRLEGVRTGAQ
ncbi:MAG: DUF1598 domain-containing protein, partial [Planctomycetaceae bacterium]